jgi:hypothetical protein
MEQCHQQACFGMPRPMHAQHTLALADSLPVSGKLQHLDAFPIDHNGLLDMDTATKQEFICLPAISWKVCNTTRRGVVDCRTNIERGLIHAYAERKSRYVWA